MAIPSRPSDERSTDLYQLMDELDRLEELLEDMDALGVTSRAEVERRIKELDARVDALEPEDEA